MQAAAGVLSLLVWPLCLRSARVAVSCLSATLSGALSSGCITSGPGEYGLSAEVLDLQLEQCPDGMIDDAEDGNGQITVVGERSGYWFTIKDELGSTIEPDTTSFQMAQGGPEGSKHMARMVGKTAAGGPSVFPYVGMGFNLSNPKSPFDAGTFPNRGSSPLQIASR